MSVDADGAIRSVQSLGEGRLLFGRGQVLFYKVQSGIVVGAQRPEWAVRVSPASLTYSARIFEGVEVVQTFELVSHRSLGCLRRVRLRNAGQSQIRLRVLGFSDPTSAHYREGQQLWGSLGVNAFNRESHVALDEVSEPHPARVIGSYPAPSRYHMTTDRSRSSELLQAGDLPEQTAGMSGLVLVLSLHETDLGPGEEKTLLFAWLYSNRLEDVLSEFGRLQGGERQSLRKPPPFACSSLRVSEAFEWARNALEGAQYGSDRLDSAETMRGLEYVNPAAVEAVFARLKAEALKDGLIRHSASHDSPGVLETALTLSGFSRHLSLSGDKKGARPHYAFLRKGANALAAHQRPGSIPIESDLPQGWRRLLGSGYPAGEVPEVTLAVASAMSDFAGVSKLLGKGEEAAKFRERSDLAVDGVGKRLLDERGSLGLCLEPSGKVRSDETADLAVSFYRNPGPRGVASSGVHRLMEKDFETEYGPRTVPTSNRLYFHGSYGQGQVGGYWTRAALAFACLSYSVGLPGIGSLAIEKVSRLVTDDALKLGGIPGEFPYWVDVESRESHGERSDPVSGSRFIQALVEGELGFSMTGGGTSIRPSELSSFKWVLSHDLWLGERSSVFVGRGGGKAHTFASCQRADVPVGQKFSKCEQLDSPQRGLHLLTMYLPGQVLCIGNSTGSHVKVHATFTPKAPGLAKRLVTPLEEFDPTSATWNKVGSIRVSPSMSFDAPIGPGDWKVYRVSDA